MNFLTSGSLGDIIYALPTIRALGGGTVYVKESYFWPPYGSLYTAIRDLLMLQPCVQEVKPYSGNYPPFHYDPKIHIDFDLDTAMNQPMRGRNHNIRSCLNAFNLPNTGWSDPWLILDEENKRTDEYSLIHLTPRWRDYSVVDWERVYMTITGKVYFIGFADEHADFCHKYGQIEHWPTGNILELARVIRDCQALYCNQSVSLTVAQGIGKKYWLEQKPTKTNCLMYTHNENILK